MPLAKCVWVDAKSYVVATGRTAAALTSTEFCIFQYVRHHSKPRIAAIADALYRGVGNPPLYPYEVVRVTVLRLNAKLERLGIKVACEVHRTKSFYEIVTL